MTTARYLPERGGTAIHTHEVARRMTEAGLQVTVITTAVRPAAIGETTEDGVHVIRVRARPRRTDYYFAPGLVRVLRKDAYDLVHCQGYHTLVAPITMITALARRIPYVVSFHSGGHSSSLRRAARPLQARLLRPLLRRASALIAVSEFEADLFARRLALPRDALSVIPSGVELPPGRSGEQAEQEQLIASVGRVESYKGHHRVIESLPLVRAVRPEMRLRVVGTGPFEPELRRIAARLHVSDAVDIAPIAVEDRSAMAALLERAAVVALLSDYESQGLAAQEALALGRPLVVSDSSALAELRGRPNVRVIAQGAPPAVVAQAILELAEAEREPPVPSPTWSACVAAILSLYETVVASPA